MLFRSRLLGENTKKVYRLGDQARVQLVRADLERRQLDFALVDVLERTAAGARKGRPPAPSRRDAPRAPRHSMKGRRR